jgi:hypothetical protein
MKSPFPGMNPFLEQPDGWHEFHEALCGAMIEWLVANLPEAYTVRGNENVYIRELSADERGLLGRPDVFVTSQAHTNDKSSHVQPAMASAPQTSCYPAVDIVSETTIEIHDKQNRSVLAAIELLSPANKSTDPQAYLQKRQRYVASAINLVEIDLLRGGRRPDMQPPIRATDYCVVIGRAWRRPEAQVWAVGLREVLPTVPIPLRETDAEPLLPLQVLFAQTFERRGFAKFIYDNTPDPQLSTDDAA